MLVNRNVINLLLFVTNSSGSAYGNEESRKVRFTGNANLRAGMNKISLLSVAVGLQVSHLGPFL